MSPEREREILEIVAQALRLPAEGRDAFLQEKLGEDPIGLGEARSILAYQSRSEMLDKAESTQTLRGFTRDEIVGERYRIVRLIGHGGMGDVYEAEDLAHPRRRRIALKTIRSDIAANKRTMELFESEIDLGRTVTHHNVCRIYDFGFHRDQKNAATSIPYLTMELLDGPTLADHLRDIGLMQPAEALPLLTQMASALHAAHQVNILHRDFKPGNVMLVSKGASSVRAVVTDLGLATEISDVGVRSQLTSAGVGTPDYMSPEQVSGTALGRASDIYSLGVVAYQMVTGNLPFEGETALVRMVKRLHEPPVPPRSYVPDLPPAWETAILRCLRLTPDQRFTTTIEFVGAIDNKEGVLLESAGSVNGAHPPAAGSSEFSQPVKRSINSRTAAIAAVLALSIASVAAYSLRDPIASTLHVIASTLRPPPFQKRVAVLKFENVGNDRAQAAFCDGLMEILSSKLSTLEQFQGSLSVVPTSEVRKEHVTSAREARRNFDATLVITGSVQRSSNGIHLIVNVVDATELKQLRSLDILIPTTDAATFQNGLVEQVAHLLGLEVKPEAQRLLAKSNTRVPGAYEFYLQGIGYLLSGVTGADHAITEFRHALDLDPLYALAFTGLGQAYWTKYLETKDPQWITQAWSACEHAIRLNSHLAEAHITLSILYAGTGRYEEAAREAQQATTIEPGNFQAYTELARALERLNRPSEAEAELKRAIDLRPGYWNNYVRLATFYFRHGRYGDAEPLYRHVINLVPDNPAGYTDLGVIYHLEGREAEAERILKQSLQVRPTEKAYSNLATVYFFTGRYAEAVPIMERLTSTGTKEYFFWGNLGDAYRWTPGRRQDAQKAYSRAIQLATEALTINSRDPRALSSRGLYEAKSGDFEAALRDAQLALAAAPHDNNVLFSTAVVYELASKRSDALEYIGMAVRRGYSLNEISHDPELANLRQDARYKELLRSRLEREIR